MNIKKLPMSKKKMLKVSKKALVQSWQNEEQNILVVGDPHTPFDLLTYLDFLLETYNRYNCNRVVFIGDVIDNHYASFHDSELEAMNVDEELEFAIQRLSRYYEVFPEADVILGNHDRLVMRKAKIGGISMKWIKDFKEVLEVPNWEFHVELEIDNVLYMHGEGGTARGKAKAELQSVVQGHLHSQLYVDYMVGKTRRIFGMQVGCGIDHKQYAFAYGKAGKKPAIGCGVVLGGHTAIAVPMLLEKYD